MKNEKYFLSIDNGTQSVRAMVFDGEGQLIAKSKVEIEPYFSSQKGMQKINQGRVAVKKLED